MDEHLNAIEQTITNVKFFGAVDDGVTDDTATIQALLDNDNAYLYVPNGIYNITSNLRLRNNPTIMFESKDAIFRRMSNECSYLFINGGTGDSFSGYNGNGNIKMVGGTLDLNSNVFNKVNSAVMLRHSANNLFKDLDVLDVANGHAFDMNGCRDTIFDTCRAMGWRDLTVDKSLIAQEAFQLSVAGTDIFNWSVADGTNCKNIKFNNCFTGNSDTEGSVAYNVAVGNHSAYIKENGESIYINSCHFSGGNHYAVRLFGFKDVFGNNNHIEDFTGFIACHSSAGYTWNLDNTKNYEIDMVTRNVHFINTTLIPKDITSDRQLIIVEGSKDISGKTISIATDIFLDGVIVNGSSNMLRKLARIVDTKNVSLINLDVKGLDDGVRGTRNTNLMISGKFSRIKNEVIYLEYSTSIVDNVSCEDCAQNGNNGVVAFEDGCNNNVIRNSSIRLGRLGRQRFAVYADALAERNIVTNNILEGLEGKSLIPHSSSFDGVVLNEGNKAYSLQVIAGKLSVSELKI